MNAAKILTSNKDDRTTLIKYREESQSRILKFIKVISIDDGFDMSDIKWQTNETLGDTLYSLELSLGPQTPVTLVEMTTYELIQYSQQVNANEIREHIRKKLEKAKHYVSVISSHTRNNL